MSTNFPGDSQHSDSSDLLAFHSDQSNQAADTLDAQKRDRFELLSAYLDGEVTAAERKQVESWLATDSKAQHLRVRLLNLRRGLRSMPIPATRQSPEQTVEQVFAQVDRRPKLALIWGGVGAAIAAGLIGTLTSFLPGGGPLSPQMAKQTQPDTVQVSGQVSTDPVGPETLMIALDQPIGGLAIPHKPVVSSVDELPEVPIDKSSGNLWLYPDSNQDIR